MTLRLYHAPGSASDRIVWLLEELGASYETVIVAQPGVSGATADPRNPHPMVMRLRWCTTAMW